MTRGLLDSASLAGIDGIPMPAGLTVGDEFDLNVRVRIYELRRDRVDVSTAGHEEYLDGALHADLLVVQPSAEDGGELTKARGTFED